MIFLGVNKQLDLQTLFTQIGRYYAHFGGWYDQRQMVQTLFILGLSIAAVILAFTLLWIFRKLAAEVRVAVIGLCLLAAFIVIRAASFHHTDRFLGENVIGLRWNAVFELGSIVFVAAAGLWYGVNRPAKR